MTPAELRTIGEALRGKLWKSQLARDLGTSERIVQFWMNGERQIPEHIPGELHTLIRRQIQKLERLNGKLNGLT